MDQPSWMQDSAAPPPPPPAQQQSAAARAPAAAGDGGGNLGTAVRSTFHFVNMGLCALMAFSAVIGVTRITDAKLTAFFLGVYLFLFAVLLFAYEFFRLVPYGEAGQMMRKNFGWFYGNRGRGLYLIFVGFLNFGLDGTVPLATGITCLSWGALSILAFTYRPEWFEVEKGT